MGEDQPMPSKRRTQYRAVINGEMHRGRTTPPNVHRRIHELLAAGKNKQQIAEAVNRSRKTVIKFSNLPPPR